MGKSINFVAGFLAGLAAAGVFHYLFGPARGTTYDQQYRSRLDWALEEGEKAAQAQEAELRRAYEIATRRRIGDA